MKNIITLFLFFLYVSMNGQETYASYHSSYFDKDYDIQISNNKKTNVVTLYIDAYSIEDTYGKVNLMVREKDLANLNEILSTCLGVYSEWKKTAIENNVTDLRKDIKISSAKYAAGFSISDWYFDFDVKLEAKFVILSGKYLILISQVGDLKSSSNEYIDSKGFYIVFSTEDEIKEFQKLIDPSNIKEHLTKSVSKEDLFKQN